MISSETTESYLCRLASGEPTPGGGAAGALHAAQAAALISMVARFSEGPRFAEHHDEMAEILEEAEGLRPTALALADADEQAFGSVIAAYGLPRGSEDEKAVRSQAIQASLVAATAPPRELVTVADAIVQLGEKLVDFCNPNVVSDVAAAAEAARAAAATARVNLEINLAGIKDAAVLATLVAAIETADVVIEEADSLSQRVRKADSRVTAISLTGKELADKIKAQVATDVHLFAGTPPTLAVVVATDDDATHWYVRSIAKAAVKAGVDCRVIDLGPDATQGRIEDELASLGQDPGLHGLILQTPLPRGVATAELVGLIPPGKDVDGANPLSLGRLAVGEPAFAPATARSVVELLDHHGIPVHGRHVAVVGRSAVVGKPLAHLLLQRDATVTMCHSRSVPLARFTRPADVVVVAAGKPRLLTAEHLAPGAVVVDVGTHVLPDGTLAGDADEASISEVASALSPVPGGVGSVTTALLLLHTVEAARARLAI